MAGDYTLTVGTVGEEVIDAEMDIAMTTLLSNYTYTTSFSGDGDSHGNITMRNGGDYRMTVIINDQADNGNSNDGNNDTPDPIVLGDTDEPDPEPAPEPEPSVEPEITEDEPEPVVLGATDELPRTGFPLALLIPLAAIPLILQRREDK